jgi:2-oxoglutarate ferredoxin oxidoreductase subunit alpha
VTIRFAGDSGDGIQLTGGQFTNTTALAGNDLATFPDFPAEIRAPAGTLPGVSAFQIQFSSEDIYTAGDRPDALVAFNPAALKAHLGDLPKGGVIFANSDGFGERELQKAGYASNPLEDGSLKDYRVYAVPITSLTLRALEGLDGVTHKEKERSKNFFALGLLYWIYQRPLEPTLRWMQEKFAKRPQLAEANQRALRAGYHFGETAEIFQTVYEVPPARLAPGTYRNISGNEALALGIAAAAVQTGLPVVYGAYPITPASDVLHALAPLRRFSVLTFQAEDEIAACGAVVGAAFAGALGITCSSGPGILLKSESINLAVMAELPIVVCDIQRAGPSTGMPTKPEQGDLLTAMFGRSSDAPVGIVAPATPGECFWMLLEAVRLAITYMTPVFLLSDGYLANGAEPWRIPDISELPKIPVRFRTDPEGFYPYLRDERTLARPWAKPGTPGLEHRIGGLEKSHIYGNVSYDPDNHDRMTKLRAEKVARMAQDIPDMRVHDPGGAKLLVLGWGSTYGPLRAAVERAQREGLPVARAHLRYLNPFPRNLGEIVRKYRRVLVPEMNLGQLRWLIRAKYLVDATGLNLVRGQPLKVQDVYEAIRRELEAV